MNLHDAGKRVREVPRTTKRQGVQLQATWKGRTLWCRSSAISIKKNDYLCTKKPFVLKTVRGKYALLNFFSVDN